MNDFELTRKIVPRTKGQANELNAFAVYFTGTSTKYTYYKPLDSMNGAEYKGFRI
jgi:hypothetical protein